MAKAPSKPRKQQRKAAEATNVVVAAGKSINVSDLAEHLISALGGTRRFAEMYAKEIKDGKEGSVARAKMMDAVLKIVASATQINKTTQRNEDEMSDEELTEQAMLLLNPPPLPPAAPEAEAAGDEY